MVAGNLVARRDTITTQLLEWLGRVHVAFDATPRGHNA